MMLSYWINGDDYNQILIHIHRDIHSPVVDQYYVRFGNIVKRSKVIYRMSYRDCFVLDNIVTEDDDTVILPKGLFEEVSPYSVSGCKFKRIVVPLNMNVRFKSKALYGSDTLCSFVSLSRNVTYDSDVFPGTISGRAF